MLALSRVLYRLSIAAWLGAMAFLAFIEAPLAFGMLGPHLAGPLVGGELWILYPAAVAAGILALIGLLVRWWRGDKERAGIKCALLMVAIALMAGSYGIATHMDHIRVAAGGDIAFLARQDPQRAAFDRLHHATEDLMGVAILVVGAVVGLG